MPSRLSEYRLFLREFRRNFHTTGAVLPSGKRLCAALSRHVGKSDRPVRILEVGPGTGPATRQIAAAMGPEDSLDLVELNESFVEQLQAALIDDPALALIHSQAQIFQLPIQDLKPEAPYDLIISGLPLNNFSPELVESIFDIFAQIAAPGATLSFFEYIAIRRFKSVASAAKERQRLSRISTTLNGQLEQREFARDAIWLNLLPAWVHHLRY
jgi:phosphatidylethanolamine/phosphatidyl-N-methylethanolamine N-methyltransferase